MGQAPRLAISEEVLAWCVDQPQGTDPADALAQISQEIFGLTRKYLETLGCPATDSDARVTAYGQRLWTCLHFHWQRQAEDSPVALQQAITQIQQGGRGPAAARADLLRDVVLAQALEFGESGAAETFEQEFLPTVKTVANQVGGPRGLNLVENFTADLFLPREGRPPRISQYRGQTSLAAWLRVVVVNHCRSDFRRRDAQPLPDEALLVDRRPAANSTMDQQPCRELLRPLIAQALQAVGAEDRLLIKMLIVDETPQHQVARLLGIHSGNITRRRQKVTQHIWGGLQAVARERDKERMATDCMELVLTEGHDELRQELGTLLAESLQQAPEGTEADLR